jgi:hypothetical protein
MRRKPGVQHALNIKRTHDDEFYRVLNENPIASVLYSSLQNLDLRGVSLDENIEQLSGMANLPGGYIRKKVEAKIDQAISKKIRNEKGWGINDVRYAFAENRKTLEESIRGLADELNIPEPLMDYYVMNCVGEAGIIAQRFWTADSQKLTDPTLTPEQRIEWLSGLVAISPASAKRFLDSIVPSLMHESVKC